jgi:hypothetical protein
LQLQQIFAAPAANLQQKLAERLHCALAPAMGIPGPATESPRPAAGGGEIPSKTSAAPSSAMAAVRAAMVPKHAV